MVVGHRGLVRCRPQPLFFGVTLMIAALEIACGRVLEAAPVSEAPNDAAADADARHRGIVVDSGGGGLPTPRPPAPPCVPFEIPLRHTTEPSVLCEYAFPSNIDHTEFNVVWTDEHGRIHLLSEDENDGYSFDEPTAPTTLILHGVVCTDIDVDGGRGSLALVHGCPAETP